MDKEFDYYITTKHGRLLASKEKGKEPKIYDAEQAIEILVEALNNERNEKNKIKKSK